jgi:hypothetical protein
MGSSILNCCTSDSYRLTYIQMSSPDCYRVATLCKTTSWPKDRKERHTRMQTCELVHAGRHKIEDRICIWCLFNSAGTFESKEREINGMAANRNKRRLRIYTKVLVHRGWIARGCTVFDPCRYRSLNRPKWSHENSCRIINL